MKSINVKLYFIMLIAKPDSNPPFLTDFHGIAR